MQWLWRLLGTPPWVAEIITNQEAIMASQKDLDAAVEELDLTLDLVAAGVKAQADNTDALEAEIVKLEEQLAAGHTAIDLTGVLRVKNEAKVIADAFAKLVDPEAENPAPIEFVDPSPAVSDSTAGEGTDAAAPGETAEVAAETAEVPATDPASVYPTTANDDGTKTL
ncbi:hypothetical protein CH278_02225 [Rhodococcus sp. 05-2254-5]|uniref:hypothetical protein n=1 Tax=unclassified Rhodococcus (in: high G+C Gram-positive bacteria) TaxID=192944 RepID=UPI000B9B52A9|nr:MULTISPECIES: hypothetical protein [unclassified Rhodococcus (in: high G+C Gram-positive bacteria)]OZE39120.1 hypothetical protein CH278_02225 [Rhodococcus sp. 05-2254-5]OZE59061.1 hypothetical protein CH269_08720 [Rhodococcus sp. 05-2254-1]